MPLRDAWRRWQPALLLVLAGVLVGGSHRAPWLAPLAWIGIAVAAFALRRAEALSPVIVGVLLGCMAEIPAGFPWNYTSVGLYVPWKPQWLAYLVIDLAYAISQRAPVLLLWPLARWRRWPSWCWLPLAWIAGEALFDAAGGVSYNAWLYSQWRFPQVLRAVGLVGWTPALLACLTIAAALGDTVASRSWRVAMVAVGGFACLFLLPRLPRGDLALLDDLGAVHMRSYLDVPAREPPGVRLMIFPEQAQRNKPTLDEGPGRGVRIVPPLRGPLGVARVEGLVTRSRGGLQNSLLALAPDGTVLQARAKRTLFPLTERPWLGLTVGRMAQRLVPGAASTVLEVAGRRVVGLLCFEGLDRRLALEGRRDGGQLLVISAIDHVLGRSPIADEQILATGVLRAVEAGLPLVRSSLFGPAAMVAADGTVLARAAHGTAGVLTLRGDVPLATLGASP